MTTKSFNLSSLIPKTVVARMTSVLFIGIVIAQILGALLWYEQLHSSERDRMIEVSESMGSRIGQTIAFLTHYQSSIVM